MSPTASFLVSRSNENTLMTECLALEHLSRFVRFKSDKCSKARHSVIKVFSFESDTKKEAVSDTESETVG